MLSNKNLSIIFLFTLFITPYMTLDFFFYSKFYNDGACKSIEELEKYMLKSKRQSPEFNVLEPLLLTNTENPIVDFGLYLTSNQKSQLEGAHAFFKTVYPSMTETEKIYFPDMISCVTQIPFFSFFGLRDTYGIMYNLVPSLEKNREDDLSGDEYTLNDFVDIYLDAFKALTVLINHDYFLTEISHDEIGVVYNSEIVNTHIRGKIRHLHHLRTTAGNCHPKNMKNFNKMFESLTKFGESKDKVDLKTSNPCQLMNLHDTWNLFIESLTSYYNRQKGVYFNFSNCIQDMVERHNTPEINGPQGFCPEEIQVAWKDIEIRRGLRSMENKGLIYSSESVAKFYIYVLTRMKARFMENMVNDELEYYKDAISHKREMINKIREDQRELTELEKIEQMILNQNTKKREQKVEKQDSFAKIIEKAELSDKAVNEQSEMTIIEQNSSMKKNSMDISDLKSLDLNEDVEIQIKEIEQKKNKIIEDENEIKDDMQNALDLKKKQIIFKFQRLVQKALIKEKKDKKEKESKFAEMNEIKNKKIEKKIKKKIGKFNTQVINMDESIQVKEDSDENFVSKIVIDNIPKNKTEEKSEITDSEEISDYNSSKSNDLDEISLMSEDNKIIQDLNEEKMRINGIKINFEDDFDINQDIKNKFENEVHGDGEVQVYEEDESEDSVIMNDRAHALKNNENILKHNLEGYVLAEASLDIKNREYEKLSKVKEVYTLRDQIMVLVDQGKTQNDEEIINLKNLILKNVNELIETFGEAESLIEFDKSLEHYTLGNLRDDLTLGELGYLEKLKNLGVKQIN